MALVVPIWRSVSSGGGQVAVGDPLGFGHLQRLGIDRPQHEVGEICTGIVGGQLRLVLTHRFGLRRPGWQLGERGLHVRVLGRRRHHSDVPVAGE